MDQSEPVLGKMDSQLQSGAVKISTFHLCPDRGLMKMHAGVGNSERPQSFNSTVAKLQTWKEIPWGARGTLQHLQSEDSLSKILRA